MVQIKSCSSCIRGRPITVNGDILCLEKGVVSPDYACQKYRDMPAQKYSKDLSNKCADCENFYAESSASLDMNAIGLCQLFSVRRYDGKQKSACSKFIKKKKWEVS